MTRDYLIVYFALSFLMKDLNKLFSNIEVKCSRTLPRLLPTTIHSETPFPRGNYSLTPVITTIKLKTFFLYRI